MDATSATAELGRYIDSGDLRRAGEWLVRHYAGDVVAMCHAMVRQRHVAEDIAQDAFSAAFTSLTSFRREASPRTWLLAITRNRCIDHLRKLQRDPWGGAESGDDEPDAQPDEAPLPPEVVLRRADISAALGTLAEAERALVILRFRHGLEYSELAEVFGLREGTVRMRMSRALSRMRAELERLEQRDVADVYAELTPAPAMMPLRGEGPADEVASDELPSGLPPAPASPAARPAPAMPRGAPPAAAPRPPASASRQRSLGAPAGAPSRPGSVGAGWWTRLLAFVGVRAEAGHDAAAAGEVADTPSSELTQRLSAMVRALPGR